jgi:hypothetical protein
MENANLFLDSGPKNSKRIVGVTPLQLAEENKFEGLVSLFDRVQVRRTPSRPLAPPYSLDIAY